MFLDKHISQRQKHVILVCLPKSTSPRTPEEYRPISLLKTVYKFLARILARRLRHTGCFTTLGHNCSLFFRIYILRHTGCFTTLGHNCSLFFRIYILPVIQQTSLRFTPVILHFIFKNSEIKYVNIPNYTYIKFTVSCS